jgi:hypothetical protein
LEQEPHRDECKSASPWFSPGLVRNHEIVLRTVPDPDHLGPGGQLALAAIPLKDIQSRGWSVDRRKFTSPWRVRLFHSEWKKRRPAINRFHVLPIPVSEIRRSAGDTERQEFVITDTAVWLNPAHAAVLLSAPHKDAAARGFRTNLLKRLPPYVELKDSFSPLEKYGYVKGMFRQLTAIMTVFFRTIFRS